MSGLNLIQPLAFAQPIDTLFMMFLSVADQSMSRDVFTKTKRRQVMSLIRSKGSRLDRAMQALLGTAGLDFVSYPRLFGSPDFLVKPNVVVFCDSSFWHGRNWVTLRKKLLRSPDPEYWVGHIARNRARDREVTRHLKSLGYVVMRFWDIAVLKEGDRCVNEIQKGLRLRQRRTSKSEGHIGTRPRTHPGG